MKISSAAALRPASDYERGGRALNLLIKDNFLRRAAREAKLVAEGVAYDELPKDAALSALDKDARSSIITLTAKTAAFTTSATSPNSPQATTTSGRDSTSPWEIIVTIPWTSAIGPAILRQSPWTLPILPRSSTSRTSTPSPWICDSSRAMRYSGYGRPTGPGQFGRAVAPIGVAA